MALSKRQIEQAWVDAGGAPKYARLMANIAMRESGGRAHINNRGTNSNGTTDWGLFQINDIWRKDPVVGPLFRSGKILTPEGNAKAAVHILKVQGPKAWATYNPSTDSKYLGGFHGASGSGPARASMASLAGARTTQTVDQAGYDKAAQKAQILSGLLSHGNPNNPLVKLGLLEPKLSEFTHTQTSGGGGGSGGFRVPSAGGGGSAASGLLGGRKASDLLELFWQGQGGIDVKHGQLEPQGFVSGHQDHVHVAAGPKTTVALGKLAQQMGLRVGENPHFGGVHPVHVNGSYHYKDEAIDVSGDPAKMRRYAHRVARLFGVR